MPESLYARLGGYDAIAAVADDLLSRLTSDPQLGRFWKHRGEDGVHRGKQLLIDFPCASAAGPLYYVGRDMKTSHRGMGVGESDWQTFIGHLTATFDKFQGPAWDPGADRSARLRGKHEAGHRGIALLNGFGD